MELADVQSQLDDVIRSKSEVEEKLFRMGREKTDLASQLEDNEEELQVTHLGLHWVNIWNFWLGAKIAQVRSPMKVKKAEELYFKVTFPSDRVTLFRMC